MWDENDDRQNHPEWCFCTECGGGGERPAHWENEELGDTVAMTVSFIEKTIRDMTRTVFKANRKYNHYEMENKEMSFHVGENISVSTRGIDRKQKGLPFLDPEKDLGADKRRVKITWAGDPKEANVHAGWAVVTVKLESVNSKARRLWTLGKSNPSLDTLIAALGSDAHQWKDREIWAWCDKNNPSETPFVRIEVIPTDQAVQTAAAEPAATTGTM